MTTETNEQTPETDAAYNATDGLCLHAALREMIEFAKSLERRLRAAEAEREGFPFRLSSALWNCSTLRHGMFTPPEFRRICERVITDALTETPTDDKP